MADQPNPQPQPQPQPQDPSQPPAPETDPIVTDLRRQAAEARMRVRELEDQQRQRDVAEDANKSEAEKEKGRADRLEKRLMTMEQQQARHEVAADKKIPVELLEHVRGDNRALLEATADRMLDYAKSVAEAAVEAAAAAAARPRRSSDPVARGAPVAEPLDMNEYIRAGFRR